MAQRADALKVGESAHDVRDELREVFRGPLEGTTTIPKATPAQFVVDGDRSAPFLAAAVMGKLLRAVRETGEWPRRIWHVAG